ncbi:hypothetical protein RFI_08187 [Reticulomyxa filosa]|uniref:Uncharacterized protein n=1 Tax=Reticulomyxa filosa TaxID=46433 RepID=X6NSN7_RETFI|nr:hypothetical protein RFI_08187 [Reticulomyxa filosa]|eukprot:ETO28938.1 hypothetical protein RFI_08187 [Reticulomyxa filosa]
MAVTGVSSNLSSSSSSSSSSSPSGSSHNGNTTNTNTNTNTNTKETTTDAVGLPNNTGRLMQIVVPPHEFMAKLQEKCERLVRYTCTMQVKVAALLMLCYPLRYWASAVNLHCVGNWDLGSVSLSNTSISSSSSSSSSSYYMYHLFIFLSLLFFSTLFFFFSNGEYPKLYYQYRDKDKKSRKMDRTNGNHFHSGSSAPYLPNWDQLFDEKMREETNKRKTVNLSSQVTSNHNNAKVEASVQTQNGVSENIKSTNNKAVSNCVETHTQSKNVKPIANEKHKHGTKNNGKANRNRK